MESIGTIIKTHRLKKGMTQEEVGNKVFVSKQAVSKWETGKTLPDIETVRKLCDILEINKDEILDGSIQETKNNRNRLKISIAVSAVCLFAVLFFLFDGVGYIDRHTQSSVAYLSVFSDGELLTTKEYEIASDLDYRNLENSYKFNIDYGEIRGTLYLYDKYNIDFGFINTNNWHNVHIRLDISQENGQTYVRQTISYQTDGNYYQVIITEDFGNENSLSVFKDGV